MEDLKKERRDLKRIRNDDVDINKKRFDKQK